MFRQKTVQEKSKNKKKRTAKEERERLRNKDKNRKRNCTVAFRMTEIERDLLDEKVKLSGRLKQEYLTEAVLNHEVTFVGDRQVFNILTDNLKRIERELKEIDMAFEVDEKDMYILKTILEMFESLYEK
ncbi:MAG: plasmid mobilization protein [Peptoniphilaceae bacterium]